MRRGETGGGGRLFSLRGRGWVAWAGGGGARVGPASGQGGGAPPQRGRRGRPHACSSDVLAGIPHRFERPGLRLTTAFSGFSLKREEPPPRVQAVSDSGRFHWFGCPR